VHQELKKKGVTLTLLWEEYRQAVGERGYQYTAFCTRYKDWAGQLKRSMRQIHRAGEKLFADYAGPTVPIIDATPARSGRPASSSPCSAPRVIPSPAPPGADPEATG
jgi:transposase